MRDTSPLRCADTRPYLAAYADGELGDALREQIAQHIARCEQCGYEVLRLQAIDRLVGSLPRSYPSPTVLDRVVGAVATPTMEPVTRESLRRPVRRLVSRSLPSFLTIGDSPVPAPLAHRSRALTSALSALAAVLVISFALFAVQRLPRANSGHGNQIATPSLQGTTLEQTRRKVDALASQLGFTPVLPSYLPPGAHVRDITVGPAAASKSSRVLDITWTVPSQHLTLYLREAPEQLTVRNDWAGGTVNPSLSWQLAGDAPWRPGTLQDRLGDWSIGQDRAGFSTTLAVRGDSTFVSYGRFVGAIPTDTDLTTLRLVSLSMDLPYLPLTIQPPSFSSAVLHYTAYSTSGAGRMTWQVYLDPIHNREWADVTSGTIHYTDISDGTHVLRLDQARGVYAYLPISQASDPRSLQPQASALFMDANTALTHGALWNIGETRQQNRTVLALYLVAAPYPTYVYLDPATLQVIGGRVDYESHDHPGGPQSTSQLSPLDGCPDLNYVSVELMPSAPAGQFNLATNGYTLGAPAPTVSCV